MAASVSRLRSYAEGDRSGRFVALRTSIFPLLTASALAPPPAQQRVNDEPQSEDNDSHAEHVRRLEHVAIHTERLGEFRFPEVSRSPDRT